jgi:hypothetical protein
MILSEPVLLLMGDISTLGEFVLIYFLTKQVIFGVFYSHILKKVQKNCKIFLYHIAECGHQ